MNANLLKNCTLCPRSQKRSGFWATQDSAEQMTNYIWHGRHFISGKNLVFQESEGAEPCFFQDAVFDVCIVKMRKYRGWMRKRK